MIKIQCKYQHLYKSYIAFPFCSLLESEKMWSLGGEKEAKLFEFLAVLCNVCPPVQIHTLYSDFNGKSFQCWHFIRRPAVIPVTDVSSESCVIFQTFFIPLKDIPCSIQMLILSDQSPKSRRVTWANILSNVLENVAQPATRPHKRPIRNQRKTQLIYN